MINWQLSKQGYRWPVSADRTAGSSVDPSRSSIFEVIGWHITSFKWPQAQVYFFQWSIWNMLCFCYFGPALLRLWFQTDLGCQNSAILLLLLLLFFFLYTGGEDLFLLWSHVGHALRPTFYVLIGQNFDRWVHAENLCSTLKVVYFDSWSGQSFVSTCDVFNCLFPLYVQNEIQLLSRVFCYSWLVCLLRFLFEKCVACQNSVIRLRMASFSFSPCLMRKTL